MSETTTDNTPDFYVQQLQEIFLSCDSSGTGFLRRDDVLRLCTRLNLDSDASQQIVNALHVESSADRRISFDQFKEAFISILTEPDDVGEAKSLDGLENAIDLSEEERHVQAIFAELGIGANGYVTRDEFQRVCQYLKMDQMADKELDQLFDRLDVDGDGLLNFTELFHGLFETEEPSQPEPVKTQLAKTRRPLSLPLDSSYTRPSKTPRFDHPVHGWEGVYAFLNRDGLGYANSEFIIHLWESFGITEGSLIIKLLRFDEKKPVSLRDLSAALVDEVHCFEVDNDILYRAGLRTMEHALDFLHSMNEDLKHEKNRLSDELTRIRSRNTSLVKDFDDAYNLAEVNSIQKQHLAEEKNQTKYQELLAELNQETESCAELQRQVDELKQEVTALRQKIKEAETEPADDSVSGSVRRDNWTKEHYEAELKNLMRGISMERKDIEGSFKIEIDELEQRHQLEVKSLKDEFKHEKDELIASHKRTLENALAECERDLLTEFSKESVRHGIDADRKELLEQLEAANENARLKTLYADDVERRLLELQNQVEAKKSTDGEMEKEEELKRRREQLLRERFEEEKLQILNNFQAEIADMREEHQRELLEYEDAVSQRIADERKRIEASVTEEILRLERANNVLKEAIQEREKERERFQTEAERVMFQKEAENELVRKELEQELFKKSAELKLIRKQAEQTLSNKDAEMELFKTETELILHRLNMENETLKKEIEQKSATQSRENGFKKRGESLQKEAEKELIRKEFEQELVKKSAELSLIKKQAEQTLSNRDAEMELFKTETEHILHRLKVENESLKKEVEQISAKKSQENEFKKQREGKVDEEVKHEDNFLSSRLLNQSSERDALLRLQIEELCRNNVRLKDELERKEEELLRLQPNIELKHQTPVGQPMQLNDNVIAERNLLKKQLQLTVNQLSEATAALSLTSVELSQEKESGRKMLSQMVDKKRYDDLVARLRHVEAKSHHLQHNFDLRAAETTKLLNLSKVVSHQKLNQLTEENEKLEDQVRRQKTLINDQLAKILKQTDELVKGDHLIHDLYVENAHLLKCLQTTEGHRQDSDFKVQSLEEKCLTLSHLFHSIGTAAIRY